MDGIFDGEVFLLMTIVIVVLMSIVFSSPLSLLPYLFSFS